MHTYFECLYFYCVKLLNTHTFVMRTFFTREASVHFTGLLFRLGNETVARRTAVVVLSALLFFAVITKLYLFYTDGLLFP